MIGPQFQRLIDGLHIAHAFIKRIDRLVDHRDQDTVDDEGRVILGAGRCFAQTADHGQERVIGLNIGRDAPDQFDQLHHWHRVHEVKPHKTFGPVGARGETGDRD